MKLEDIHEQNKKLRKYNLVTQCDKISKPFPDYTDSGFHYLDVAKTPVQIDDKARIIDDYQKQRQPN